MKINIIKLGTIVKDTATGLEGMLTLLKVAMDHSQLYCFQPRALNPETGGPVKAFWLVKERLADFMTAEADLPFEVLGTPVTEIGTGFTGKAVNLYLHTTGCVHVDVQPAGIVAKTGAAVVSHDFSIQRLRGPAIAEMSEAAAASEKAARPSPGGYDRPEPTFTA